MRRRQPDRFMDSVRLSAGVILSRIWLDSRFRGMAAKSKSGWIPFFKE